MRLLHGVSLFFFSLPFSLCSHNEQADKTGRVSLSFSLSLFNWFRSLLSFSRVLLFSVVACSRLAACFARFVNAVRLECNSSFLLVIFIHGTPSATQPLLFFFFSSLFSLKLFLSLHRQRQFFFVVFHLSLLYKSHDTLLFSFRSSHSHTCKKKKKKCPSVFFFTPRKHDGGGSTECPVRERPPQLHVRPRLSLLQG